MCDVRLSPPCPPPRRRPRGRRPWSPYRLLSLVPPAAEAHLEAAIQVVVIVVTPVQLGLGRLGRQPAPDPPGDGGRLASRLGPLGDREIFIDANDEVPHDDVEHAQAA